MFGSVSGRSVRMLGVIAVLAGVSVAVNAPKATLSIKVDQVGYPSTAPKVAFVTAPGKKFELKRASDNATVFKGKLSAAIADPDSGDKVQSADFSKFQTEGTYYLEVPGVGRSWNFTIKPDVISPIYYLAMRAFYGQRCGTDVDLGQEFPGYSYRACHLTGAFHSSSGKEGPYNNVGGWHDAGDYGRYIINSGITTGTLLWSWEIYGDKLKNIKLNIPESGNRTPDVLDEIRWNLEWMLKMQDDDGGVWHKQTSEDWPGFILPDEDKLPNLVIGTGKAPYKDTCATGDLAAVAAIAARVYQPFDAKFAARNLEAARKAWLWAAENPNVTFRNPEGIRSGEYGDDSCRDERLWASAELWRTTGEQVYNDYFLKNYAEFHEKLESPPGENWREVAPMGMWTYALAQRQGDAAAIADIRKTTVDAAHAVVEWTQKNPYHVSLKAKDYVWGSNGVAGAYGVELLVANVFQPDKAFVQASLDNLHYLLGRNAFSLSWVSQVGENPYHHPHHRPSGGDKNAEPWPGLLSGGPNANRQDEFTAKLPKDTPPAKIYADEQGSYASNEICINWQAALVFTLAGNLP